eukprot:11218228-Lingulodinium_polyedra.AAC.1
MRVALGDALGPAAHDEERRVLPQLLVADAVQVGRATQLEVHVRIPGATKYAERCTEQPLVP